MKYIASILVFLALLACSRTSTSEIERPGDDGKVPAEDKPDFSAELADRTVRARCGAIVLDADEPGILYSTDGRSYTFVDVDNGSRIDFSSEEPSLSVCGIKREVIKAERLQSDAALDWWAVYAKGDTAIIVTRQL